MKESSTSLRWFFGVIGTLTLLSTLLVLWITSAIGLSGLIGTGSTANVVLRVIYLVEAVGLIYFAFALPKFLNPEKAKYVEWFLLFPLALAVITDLIQFFSTSVYPDFITLVISGLITWYLYHNVHRLSYVPAQVVVPVTSAKKGTISGGVFLIIILGLITILVSLFIWYGNHS